MTVLYDGNEWRIAGWAVADVAEKHSTPTYLYDRGTLDSQFQVLRDALPDCVEIYYSIKANPNPAIVRHMAHLVAGLEAASAAEYEIARSTGLSPDRFLIAGPGKTRDEIEWVLSNGIGELHVESLEELDAIVATGLRASVSVRFNPACDASGGAMRMGGRPAQFGFDEELLPDVVDKILGYSQLAFRGLHMFAGTQLLDAGVLLAQWRHAIEVAGRVAKHIQRPLETVDLGGGLGIPYFSGETALDMDHIKNGAAELFGGISQDPLLSRTRFILEPGRFLVGPAGVYLARVVSVKWSRGTRFVVLDGGMNHHLAASGNLGQVIKRDYPILNVSQPDDAEREPTVVVGPLCTPLDTLGRRVELPETKAGDLIAVLQSGAYGLSASPTGFLSHRLPAEVLIGEDDVELIASRGSFGNPLQRQSG